MDENSSESITLQEQFNRQLGTTFLSGRYSCVKVLILYWEESDRFEDYRREGEDLGHFFQESFRFDVEYFDIPVSSSQLALSTKISNTLLSLVTQRHRVNAPCLLIIHYGGHGDPDDDYHKGEQRRAVWRAYQRDGPSVRWYEIQQTFREIDFDILLLLDCCYSAQAGRGREGSQGKIELLAASGSREETPEPGDGSFTNSMIREMRVLLERHGYVGIAELHTKLMHRRADLYTVPFHARLRFGPSKRSIRLEPLTDSSLEVQDSQSWISAVRVLIQTTEQLDNARINEIACWLQSDAPRMVTRVQAESVLLKTSNIRKFIQNDLPDRTRPLVKTLDKPVLDDIQNAWVECQELIRQYSAQHKNPGSTQEWARWFLEQLDDGNTKILESLEKNILLSSELFGPKMLEEALGDPASELLGIQDQLKLRQIICSTGSHGVNERDAAAGSEPTESLKLLEEYKEYGENQSSSEITQIEERIKLLARLLQSKKRSEFRCLRLRQWEHRQFQHRFVFHFEIPSGYGDYHQSLYDVIKDPWEKVRPSLGERFKMAYGVAQAVYQWHMVGWVHQGISSHNILFFLTTGQGIDFSAPFLQGFDFARPNTKPSIGYYVDNIMFNIYRHPDRQGPSRDGHLKIHDLYSLGIVLLEIGLWRRAIDIIKDTYRKSVATSPKEEMYSALKDAAYSRLHHYAGKAYQKAVICCLKTDFGIHRDDHRDSELAAAVRGKVLDNLAAWKYIK